MKISKIESDVRSGIKSERFPILLEMKVDGDHRILVPKYELSRPFSIGNKSIKKQIKGMK
jgi:hypothetical protein